MIIEKIDGSKFSAVKPSLAGRIVAAIGGGDSLTKEQVEAVRVAGVACVVINDAYLWAPFADLLYAADQSWWDAHAKGVAKPFLGMSDTEAHDRFHAFAGERCTIQPTDNNVWPKQAIHVLRNMHHPYHGLGLSTDPEQIVTGRNGGWQTVNILSLARARIVILLGFDGKASQTGRSHWHGGHAKQTSQRAYEEYRRSFSAGEDQLIKAGTQVINCSPDSVIDSFRKMPLERALCL